MIISQTLRFLFKRGGVNVSDFIPDIFSYVFSFAIVFRNRKVGRFVVSLSLSIKSS